MYRMRKVLGPVTSAVQYIHSRDPGHNVDLYTIGCTVDLQDEQVNSVDKHERIGAHTANMVKILNNPHCNHSILLYTGYYYPWSVAIYQNKLT